MSSSFTASRRSSPWLFTVLSFTLSFLILVSYWARYIRGAYYPSGDEIALLVHSSRLFHPSVLAWITQGFGRYFLSYPQWAPSSTDFVRPGANITYYLNSLVFGSRWSWYLLTTYFIQSALVAVTVYTGIVKLRLNGILAATTGILCFLSPAFSHQELFFPSFSFDLLGAVLVLLGILRLLSSKWISAMVFFTVAIFTKETMLFAPIVGAVWMLADRSQGPRARRLMTSVALLLPVLAWELVRLHAFRGHSGVYVLQTSWKMFVVRGLHGILAWPFGARNYVQVFSTRYLFFVLNSLFWVSVIACIGYAWRRKSKGSSHEDEGSGLLSQCGFKDREAAIILTFCASSLVMPIALSLPQRFGAVSYPLLYLTLAVAASFAAASHLRLFAMATLLVLPLVAMYQKAVDPLPFSLMQEEWILARSYIDEIHQTTASTIFLLNDATGGFTTPFDVARFAAYPGALIRISNVELTSFPTCSKETYATATQEKQQGLVLSSTIQPACGSFTFYGVPSEFIVANRDHLARVTNDGVLHYRIPPYAPLPQSRILAVFGKLEVELDHPKTQPVVLTPEFRSLRYRELSLVP